MPWAAKIQIPSHQSDVAKTNENLRFLLILEGWRLDNAHFGSLGEVLAWLLAGCMAAGWLAGGLGAASWLAGRPQAPQDLRGYAHLVVTPLSRGAGSNQPFG